MLILSLFPPAALPLNIAPFSMGSGAVNDQNFATVHPMSSEEELLIFDFGDREFPVESLHLFLTPARGDPTFKIAAMELTSFRGDEKNTTTTWVSYLNPKTPGHGVIPLPKITSLRLLTLKAVAWYPPYSLIPTWKLPPGGGSPHSLPGIAELVIHSPLEISDGARQNWEKIAEITDRRHSPAPLPPPYRGTAPGCFSCHTDTLGADILQDWRRVDPMPAPFRGFEFNSPFNRWGEIFAFWHSLEKNSSPPLPHGEVILSTRHGYHGIPIFAVEGWRQILDFGNGAFHRFTAPDQVRLVFFPDPPDALVVAIIAHHDGMAFDSILQNKILPGNSTGRGGKCTLQLSAPTGPFPEILPFPRLVKQRPNKNSSRDFELSWTHKTPSLFLRVKPTLTPILKITARMGDPGEGGEIGVVIPHEEPRHAGNPDTYRHLPVDFTEEVTLILRGNPTSENAPHEPPLARLFREATIATLRYGVPSVASPPLNIPAPGPLMGMDREWIAIQLARWNRKVQRPPHSSRLSIPLPVLDPGNPYYWAVRLENLFNGELTLSEARKILATPNPLATMEDPLLEREMLALCYHLQFKYYLQTPLPVRELALIRDYQARHSPTESFLNFLTIAEAVRTEILWSAHQRILWQTEPVEFPGGKKGINVQLRGMEGMEKNESRGSLEILTQEGWRTVSLKPPSTPSSIAQCPVIPDAGGRMALLDFTIDPLSQPDLFRLLPVWARWREEASPEGAPLVEFPLFCP